MEREGVEEKQEEKREKKEREEETRERERRIVREVKTWKFGSLFTKTPLHHRD